MPARSPSISPNPRLEKLAKGMLYRVDASGTPANNGDTNPLDGLMARAMTFQYNPETITRARAGKWESRSRRNQNVPSPQEVRARSGSGAAQLLAESETISLKVVFDATEQLITSGADVGEGVLPELAFVELMSMGRPPARRSNSGESARAVRPDELLLVLGSRTFPVVLTNLTIVEQKFASDLTPIRAEVDLRFNVLEPVDVSMNTWVQQAFDQIANKRRSLSEKVGEGSDATSALAQALNGGNPPEPAPASTTNLTGGT